MASDVWVGALTTLVGAVIGGAISLILSRQQIKAARIQRQEEAMRALQRRSFDRRFDAYSAFLTRSRSFRNAVRDYCLSSEPKPTLDHLDTLMRSANDASALVFLVLESRATYDACTSALRSLAAAQRRLHGISAEATDELWPELKSEMRRSLTDFQTAARAELEVSKPDLALGKTSTTINN